LHRIQPAVTASRFNLIGVEQTSGANAVVRGNHVHDACGSGGRIILKTRNSTFTGNVAERFGGLHVYTEQEWLEGDLGLANVRLENNTFVDQYGVASPAHVDVMTGLPNITCTHNTFVVHGKSTFRASGC
jgi:hypothetical protein